MFTLWQWFLVALTLLFLVSFVSVFASISRP
jgi:hypothetical protein